MAGQVKVNYLKRTLKSTEKYLETPLWKFFLFIFAINFVIVGPLEIALEYKREVDITSMSFIIKLFAQILFYSIVWTAVLRYFGQRDLKKLKQELNDAEVD